MATTPLKPVKRISFPELYMAMARLVSRRSTCSRLQVGAIITSIDFRYVYGLGYNGNYAGGPNKCGGSLEPGMCQCLHAEENAIINCTVSRNEPKILFTTHMPCLMCVKRLINLGSVRAVYYEGEYRDDQGVKLLRASDIDIHKLEGRL